MHYMPFLWIVWAGFAAVLCVLLLYRGTLTRYEEDQLFLDHSSDHQHRDNDAVLNKVARLRPFVRIFMGAACLTTAAILGIYVWDAIRQFYM